MQWLRGLKSPALAFVLVFTVGRAAAAGEVVQAKHARVELLVQQNAVAPGAELLFGIHFVLEPGWHIYWVNPGDSGQPPVFQWRLPEGFSAGAIQWPRPERMQSSSQLTDYGYHDDVLLVVPVHAPSAIHAAPGDIRVAVDAKWLICREICLPDHAQLQLALPVASVATPNAANASIFAQTHKLLPKPLPTATKIAASSRNDEFVIDVRAGKPITRAEFFPLEPAQVDNAAPQKVVAMADGVRIIVKKSDLLLKKIAVLRGVLVVAGSEAYNVQARVTAAQGLK